MCWHESLASELTRTQSEQAFTIAMIISWNLLYGPMTSVGQGAR